MDHIRALNQLRDRHTLGAALAYAIFDRKNGDYFCDWIEIEHAEQNRDQLIDELIAELKNPADYTPRLGFAYFPPKNDLCDRRLIYLPIKDLTVRYAIALVCSGELEMEIHDECFANRRATDASASTRFTQEFAAGGWANFTSWQRQMAESNSVLLKTDISSFYDSVSHEYLVDALCRHLQLPPASAFVQLFRRLIEVPVTYYSPSSGEIESTVTRQGLPIGDGVEGYLANLYLKDVDDAMLRVGASYGRYVDDIRLFGNTREEVVGHLRILQEQLLRKGLNLNSSKTKLAANAVQRKELIPHLFKSSDYETEVEQAGSVIDGMIDPPLTEFDRRFSEGDLFKDGGDAKDFCKYLSSHEPNGQPLVLLGDREPWHVERLQEAIARWRGSSKHASWLLAQTATYRGVRLDTRNAAIRALMSLMQDSTISSYARYRLAHHLFKLRQGRAAHPFRFIDQFSIENRNAVAVVIYGWLQQPAFELNLIGVYGMRVLGATIAATRRAFAEHCRNRCVPVRNAILILTQMSPGAALPTGAEDVEDEVSDY